MAYLGHRFAQHFVSERSCVAFAQKQKTKNVGDRVALLPFEIDVRDLTGFLFDINQEGGDGICNHGTPGEEDAVIGDSLALDGQALIEFGGVSALHLQKDDFGVGRKSMDVAHQLVDSVQLLR
jgi:hypothetical protein